MPAHARATLLAVAAVHQVGAAGGSLPHGLPLHSRSLNAATPLLLAFSFQVDAAKYIAGGVLAVATGGRRLALRGVRRRMPAAWPCLNARDP